MDNYWGLRHSIKESIHETPENADINEQITIEFSKGIEQLNLPGEIKKEHILAKNNTERKKYGLPWY